VPARSLFILFFESCHHRPTAIFTLFLVLEHVPARCLLPPIITVSCCLPPPPLLPGNNGATFATENQRVQRGSQQGTIRTTLNPAKSPQLDGVKTKKKRGLQPRKPTVDRLVHLHPAACLQPVPTLFFRSPGASLPELCSISGPFWQPRQPSPNTSHTYRHKVHTHAGVNPCHRRHLSCFGFGFLGASPKYFTESTWCTLPPVGPQSTSQACSRSSFFYPDLPNPHPCFLSRRPSSKKHFHPHIGQTKSYFVSLVATSLLLQQATWVPIRVCTFDLLVPPSLTTKSGRPSPPRFATDTILPGFTA
jgi:hypothetical protein